jgi:hypothetical protein
LQELTRQLTEANAKLNFGSSATEELIRLKDELDSLREASAKAKQHEVTIQQLKNRLESAQYLKHDIQQFEQKNEELNKVS